MLRINEIKMDLDCDFHQIEDAAAKTLKLNKNRILKTEIFKQSVDCRKGEVRFVFTVDVTVDGDCGGYNLQWAWSSGRLAGNTIGERINNAQNQ